jgi:hypothetical protein
MNRLLIVGILITSTMPLSAQGQQPELEKTLGPEYLALVKALENMDPPRETLSRATLSADSAGSLKCYDKSGIEKPC